MQDTRQHDDRITDVLTAWSAEVYRYDAQLKDFPAGQELLRASPEEQRRFVMAAVAWSQEPRNNNGSIWRVLHALSALLRRALPFDHNDLLILLRWAQSDVYGWHIEPHLSKVIERYLAAHPRTPALDTALLELVDALEARAWSAEARRRILRLKELAGLAQPDMPLLVGDVWADTAIADIAALEPDARALWAGLLQQCAAASGSTPSAKWLKATRALSEGIGAARFRATLLRWFALADQPRATPIRDAWGGERPALILLERNADILKALVWLCAEHGDSDVARALTALAVSSYRKLPGIGPRCPRLGNACIWALGQMAGHDGIAQLAVLKVRVRLPGAQKLIETALRGAAERAGLARDDLEELLAPSYGLEEVGLRREALGGVTVDLVVAGSSVELRYLRADSRRLASAPRVLREQYGEQFKELAQAAADIKQMLVAQRDRIEQLYLQRKTWSLDVWRERYLDHPLVGTLARRLIWRFERDGRPSAGIWHDGRIVQHGGQPLGDLDATTAVTLWHPLDSPMDDVLVWRDWLTAHEVQQPFKQAHREIYLLTDAERATRLYSNRFAAHIIRQHQFNALCAARGWKNQLRLMVDDTYPPAQRLLPAWGLRAEYWVEGAGDNYGTDTNDTGTYLRLATDQVRFYPIEAAQHYAHAGGGGYHLAWNTPNLAQEPLPLEQIPQLVLSEILRDVDLFVGVASVGNDPTWADGGPEGRYRDYWTSYAFGDLSETAKMRREVLSRLIPRLKIAARCRLTERFLVVRGDIRTYKIHLGSGNILMEPNDQYLCIVPARGAAPTNGHGTRFVPFEGDGTLAIILSKALLLANDTAIDDPTIVRQIRR
ncbi:MAG TPA: DUF4132 domain-containing protein [Roseiflexaceae bacterium]|nr:DUF4132 domain-containing protein [Roseiflexaceae bacterium]